ncbi:MAG TPA: hypothetical protein VJN64_11995 [Terriglobales bacterium]|nr:hypothetical protein [Terriglobales bacterium]
MLSANRKSVVSAILGFALVLIGMASLFTILVDNDGDDDTPPITVELNLVAPVKKAVQLTKAEVHQSPVFGNSTQQSRHLASHFEGEPASGLGKGSPQLLVPLRT